MGHMQNNIPPLRETLPVWLKIGLTSFGGQAGQLAVMHRILVEEKKWISERHFLQVFNYCLILPGPGPQQLAIYIGWLLHKFRGGIAAGSLFILPGFVSVLFLTILYAQYHHIGIVQGIFYGLKPAVIAIIFEALLRMGQKTLKNPAMITFAALAFIATFFFQVSIPLILLITALCGFISGKLWPHRFELSASTPPDHSYAVKVSFTKTLKVAALFTFLWLLPIGILSLLLGKDNIYTTIGLFFCKVALVTFGGAYGTMPYIAQESIHHYGWLSAGEMLDGLGITTSTPGPIVQVVQFIGFLAAQRQADIINPFLAGFFGSLIAAWSLFFPSFIWIFVSAPYIKKLRQSPLLTSALSFITAAVIGAILNVASNFLLSTLFKHMNEQKYGLAHFNSPDWGSLDISSLVISLIALVLALRYKMGLFSILGISVLLGVILF